jgi:hypothetical protein
MNDLTSLALQLARAKKRLGHAFLPGVLLTVEADELLVKREGHSIALIKKASAWVFRVCSRR